MCEEVQRPWGWSIACRAVMAKSWCGDLGGLPTRGSLAGFVDERGLYLMG